MSKPIKLPSAVAELKKDGHYIFVFNQESGITKADIYTFLKMLEKIGFADNIGILLKNAKGLTVYEK